MPRAFWTASCEKTRATESANAAVATRGRRCHESAKIGHSLRLGGGAMHDTIVNLAVHGGRNHQMP